jgi:hypothetical protein
VSDCAMYSNGDDDDDDDDDDEVDAYSIYRELD